MTVNHSTPVSEETSEKARPTMVEMIDRLSRFDGPPEQFLVNLLAVQCHLASAKSGAILRVNPQRGTEILAVYPQPAPGQTAPVWLAQSAEAAPQIVQGGKTVIRPVQSSDDLYGQPAGQHLVLLPLRGGSGVLGMAAFLVASADQRVLAASQQRLELTVSLLSLYEMRLTLQQRQGDLRRLRLAMETTAAVNEHDRFKGSAMAFCNEIASRWNCDRVSLGFLKGRYVQLKAMSHTEKFSRKMKLVQDIEAAMEETLDQDVEVLYPPPQEATFVARAAGELSKRHGPTAILSLPLRREGDVAAVLTLERSSDDPFGLDEIESLRLACDLAAPRLVSLYRQDRWVGARAAATARNALAVVLGPKHTWIKLAVIGVFVAAMLLTFVHGPFRAEGPFVFQAVKHRIVPTPFDGYLEAAYVSPGDVVIGADGERPPWRLGDADVANWPGLLVELLAASQAGENTPAAHVWGMLSPDARSAIRQTVSTDPEDAVRAAMDGVPEPARKLLLGELNAAMAGEAFYDADAFANLDPTDRQKDLLADLREGGLAGDRLVELNRSLLASALPGLLRPGPTVLGSLETAELRLELSSARAEKIGYLKKAAAAMREDKRAEAQIAHAQADQVSARIRLLEHRIAQAVIVSPIDGYVVSGDLQKQIGAPAKTGDVLFEIAALANLRAELSIPEHMIAEVQDAQAKLAEQGEKLSGELATTARPDDHVKFTVERINPVAEVAQQEQRNVFKVRVKLARRPRWLRPGMQGVGKIDIGRKPYGVLWTRDLINWIRMKLWL